MISTMKVIHQKFVFYIYFLLTHIYSVFARSVCPVGQFWELSAEACVSCALICVNSDLKGTREKCVSECPSYSSAPPISSSGKPVQPAGGPGTVPPSMMDTQLVTVLVPIAVVLLVLVVAVIIFVRHRPDLRLCDYDKNPDQGPGLPNNHQPINPSLNAAGDADDQQRQALLDTLSTEEIHIPGLESNDHSISLQDLSAGTQYDASSCNEEEEPDTAVKEVEGSHPVLPRPQYDLDETTPKNHVVKSDHFQMNMYTSQTVQNVANWSFLHDHWSNQSIPSLVQGQSVLLLPGGQTYPVADPMHEKMGVQVQDGAEDNEESSLPAINNTQPQTVLSDLSNIIPPLHSDRLYFHRKQTHVCETCNPLFADESMYQSFPGECDVHCSIEHVENVDFDSLHASKINNQAHAQSPDLTNIPFPPNQTHCPSLPSSQYHQTVVPSKDLTNIHILSLTSMPTLGPGFVEQTDSDSLAYSTIHLVRNRGISASSNLGP